MLAVVHGLHKTAEGSKFGSVLCIVLDDLATMTTLPQADAISLKDGKLSNCSLAGCHGHWLEKQHPAHEVARKVHATMLAASHQEFVAGLASPAKHRARRKLARQASRDGDRCAVGAGAAAARPVVALSHESSCSNPQHFLSNLRNALARPSLTWRECSRATAKEL